VADWSTTPAVAAAGGKLHANLLLTGSQFFWRNLARGSAFSCARAAVDRPGEAVTSG